MVQLEGYTVGTNIGVRESLMQGTQGQRKLISYLLMK
jgi:hypothetical protein